MVFYGRSYRFRKYPKKKFYRKRRYTRKVPTKSISRLSRQVARVSKELKRKRVNIWLRNDGANSTVELAQPYNSMHLCRFSQDVPIFGTDPNDLLGSKVLFKSITVKCDVLLQGANDEEETQAIEMFVVSLRDVANDIFDEAAGTLALTADVHYYRYGNANSMITYLNKKYFKIHKHDRFMLTNYGASLATSAAQNLDGTNRRIDFKLPINQVIQAPLSNVADQSWKTLNAPRDPSQNYFVLWFNDNLTTDLESPRVNLIALKKFEKLDN